MNLYDLTREYRDLVASLDEAGGEVTPEIAAALAALDGDLTAKARSIVCLIRELQIEAGAVREEADRLCQRLTVKQNAAERLKAYLLECLVTLNITKLDVGIAAVSVRVAPRPSISWNPDLPLPVGFVRVKEELDGTAAYEVWKAKGKLPTGFSVKHATFLQIR